MSDEHPKALSLQAQIEAASHHVDRMARETLESLEDDSYEREFEARVQTYRALFDRRGHLEDGW